MCIRDRYLHCNKGFIEYCTICAYLHDIGKLFIPASILQKPGKLTDEEYELSLIHISTLVFLGNLSFTSILLPYFSTSKFSTFFFFIIYYKFLFYFYLIDVYKRQPLQLVLDI